MTRLTRSLCRSLLACVCLLSTSAAPAFAQKNKPQPTPPPPVQYEIQFFNSPVGGGYLNDFNNRSQAVGWYLTPAGRKNAWYYDPQIDPDNVVDLNTIGVIGIPDGWFIASAVGLNEFGNVVGYLQRLDEPDDIRHGYVLNIHPVSDDPAAPPELTLIPVGPDLVPPTWEQVFPEDINNSGLILGRYRRADGTYGKYLYQTGIEGNEPDVQLRDLGLVVDATVKQPRLSEAEPSQFAGERLDGVAYRYTDDGSPLELFPQLTGTSSSAPTVMNSNQWGGFCGSGLYSPPKGKTVRVPIRVLDTEPEYITSLSGQKATAVNCRGDLAVGSKDGAGVSLYWDAYGVHYLNNLVVGSDADLAAWAAAMSIEIGDLNDPLAPADPTSFGEVIGRIRFADGTSGFFYLTPVQQ